MNLIELLKWRPLDNELAIGASYFMQIRSFLFRFSCFGVLNEEYTSCRMMKKQQTLNT